MTEATKHKVSIVPSLVWTAVFGINIAGCVVGIQSGRELALFGIFLGFNAALIATEWLAFLYRRQLAEWEGWADDLAGKIASAGFALPTDSPPTPKGR